MPEADRGERKSRLRTIRISESLEHSLEKEAADEGTTINADVNSIISRHFDWDKKIRESGVAELPRPLLMGLLEGCSDETLARIGRDIGPAMWKEMAEFFFQDSTPDGILNLLAMRSRFDPNMRTAVTKDGDTYTIVMRHDWGHKWSIIARNALQELVKQSFHVVPRITQGESVVTARFKVKSRNLPVTLPPQS